MIDGTGGKEREYYQLSFVFMFVTQEWIMRRFLLFSSIKRQVHRVKVTFDSLFASRKTLNKSKIKKIVF